MEPLKQNPKPGIILAVVILLILLLVQGLTSCSSRSPGHSAFEGTVWRTGNGTFCCEVDAREKGYFRLDCGGTGEIYVFSNALDTKIPCTDEEGD